MVGRHQLDTMAQAIRAGSPIWATEQETSHTEKYVRLANDHVSTSGVYGESAKSIGKLPTFEYVHGTMAYSRSNTSSLTVSSESIKLIKYRKFNDLLNPKSNQTKHPDLFNLTLFTI